MFAGIIAYLIFLIMSYKYKKESNRKKAKYIIFILVIINIFVLATSLYSSKGKGYAKEFIKSGTVEENCSTINGTTEKFKEAIEYIKENDKDFYRIAKKELSYQNLSIMYEYNPIQLFLSIGNGSVFNLASYLEDNSYTTTRCISGADRRTKYTTLLANKYYICDKKASRYVPYGYSLYHEIDNTQIYINKNYLSPGIVYNSYITKEQFESLSPLSREDLLITAAMIKNDTKIDIQNNGENIQISKPISLNYLVKDNKLEDNSIETTKNNETIELIINEIPKNYELYLSINNIKNISEDDRTDFKITAKIDGIKNSEEVKNKISSAYYMENPNFLMNLGITKKSQSNKLKLTFSKKGIYTFDNLEILAVSMDEYEKKINKLKTNAMGNIEYGNDYIKGTVSTDSRGILQITTSYSDGWKAYVDGKEQEVIKVNEAFIGTIIEEGEHEIEFKYETPYLTLGIVFSILGLVSFIIILITEKRKRYHI